jgi:hypothetical protein
MRTSSLLLGLLRGLSGKIQKTLYRNVIDIFNAFNAFNAFNEIGEINA